MIHHSEIYICMYILSDDFAVLLLNPSRVCVLYSRLYTKGRWGLPCTHTQNTIEMNCKLAIIRKNGSININRVQFQWMKALKNHWNRHMNEKIRNELKLSRRTAEKHFRLLECCCCCCCCNCCCCCCWECSIMRCLHVNWTTKSNLADNKFSKQAPGLKSRICTHSKSVMAKRNARNETKRNA